MTSVNSPEDLVAWQVCMELGDVVFEITATAPVARDFKFCDQIRRSSRAPAALIAEGFGRFTPREFVHYLRMAIGSLLETRTHLETAARQTYLTDRQHADATRTCARALDLTRKLLAAKIRQVERDDEQNRAARRPQQKPGD